MRRILLATLLLLHGLAHASVGVWASSQGPLWLVTSLWGTAMLGYFAAALALFRMPVLRRHWRGLLNVATASSVVVLALYSQRVGLIGVAIDIVLYLFALEAVDGYAEADIEVAEAVGVDALEHPIAHRALWALGAAWLLYSAAVVLVRPIYLHWGTTPSERTVPLLGDDMTPGATYRVDHAITIHAPADSVWPWLVQLGQNRGGFYSYSWLERLAGDDVHNADRIHPEWQRLAQGDTIRAVQPGYLAGRLGQLGWRVSELDPGRGMYLENWGAFVLQPVDSTTTRLIIRTRGAPNPPTVASVVLGPLSVFLFEPAHFIMQRGMMRGIRARAEQGT